MRLFLCNFWQNYVLLSFSTVVKSCEWRKVEFKERQLSEKWNLGWLEWNSANRPSFHENGEQNDADGDGNDDNHDGDDNDDDDDDVGVGGGGDDNRHLILIYRCILVLLLYGYIKEKVNS